MKKTLLAALLAVPSLALAQDMDFSKVEVKARPAAGNVHMLEGAGGNIGVSVGPDGVLIVDDQFAPLAPKIHAAIDKLSKGKIQFVLNTHWHFDHTGGNATFGKEGHVVAHTQVRTRMSTEQKLMGRTFPPSPKEALPVITYDQGMSLWFNGEEVKLMHLPGGHTDGDTVVYFTGSNVVHTGDLFVTDVFPFVDTASGGSVQGILTNAERLLQTLPPGAKIIPGHGPLAGREELERYVTMLRDTLALVRAKKEAGKTLEQVKAEGVPERYQGWGKAFIKTEVWLETVYKGLDTAKGQQKGQGKDPAPAPSK